LSQLLKTFENVPIAGGSIALKIC